MLEASQKPEAGRTIDGGQQHSRVVVGDDIGVAVLGFVYLQVRVLPCELLAWIYRLQWRQKQQIFSC